jgi:hypothetical protein
MEVPGHDDITDHHEVMLGTDLFEDVEEKISMIGITEERPTVTTATGDEVKVICAVEAFEFGGHSSG